MKRPNFAEQNQEYIWTKRDVVVIYNLLKNMRGIRGIQFLKISGLLLDELKGPAEALSVKSCIPAFEAMQLFEQEIQLLQKKYRIQSDADIVNNEMYLEEINALNETNSNMIKEYEEDVKEYNQMLNEPFTEKQINWPRYPEAVLPDNLPSEIYFSIMPLIDKKENKG